MAASSAGSWGVPWTITKCPPRRKATPTVAGSTTNATASSIWSTPGSTAGSARSEFLMVPSSAAARCSYGWTLSVTTTMAPPSVNVRTTLDALALEDLPESVGHAGRLVAVDVLDDPDRRRGAKPGRWVGDEDRRQLRRHLSFRLRQGRPAATGLNVPRDREKQGIVGLGCLGERVQRHQEHVPLAGDGVGACGVGRLAGRPPGIGEVGTGLGRGVDARREELRLGAGVHDDRHGGDDDVPRRPHEAPRHPRRRELAEVGRCRSPTPARSRRAGRRREVGRWRRRHRSRGRPRLDQPRTARSRRRMFARSTGQPYWRPDRAAVNNRARRGGRSRRTPPFRTPRSG